jgi:aromatic ring-opening dioxygenase catalytic subunit (LigB family)
MSTPRLPTYFIPHGAGPCFFMDWDPPDTWNAMRNWLIHLLEDVRSRPKALLVVSGHWEAPRFTINTAEKPSLMFDYSGFPPHTYELAWPAPGSPSLAIRVGQLLSEQGIEYAEAKRDLDHGVFIPLKVAVPEADIPVVQLSLQRGLDPAAHLALGRALAPLRDEGVLIIGSGMSFHNMRRFQFGKSQGVDADSVRFNEWLKETVAMQPTERKQRLIRWAEAPGGRESHPREEHLLPLHVVAGAALDDAGEQFFQDTVMGTLQGAFRFRVRVV